jgi:hypothetical protein
MPYNHAGEIGDIWKHLPICDILAIEKPRRYVETNSATRTYPTVFCGNFRFLVCIHK